MKKATMLIAVLCVLVFSDMQAQVNKGRSLIGVSTSFSYFNLGSDILNFGVTSSRDKGNSSVNSDLGSDRIITLNLMPRYGYFIADNFALGINLCLASSSEKPDKETRYNMTSFGAGPFLRYYFPGSKILPFIEASSLFGSVSNKYTAASYENSSSSSTRSLGGGIGMAVKIGEKVTFDMMAGYNSTSVKAKENNPDNIRTVQGTFGLRFGFVVLFGS